MEQSHSSEANRFSVSQEIPRVLWKPKVHYHFHKCPHLSLSWASSIQSIHPTFHFLKSHLNVIFIVPCIIIFYWNNQQMQLYAVNFIPLLNSLYMFREGTHAHHQEYNCIYSHWYHHSLAYVVTATCSQGCLAPSGTSSRDNLRQPMIVPVAVDTVVLLMMGVCAARNM